MKLAAQLSPSITSMIRLDHSHVMVTFHRFRADTPSDIKQGLVNTTCLALEVHAQLEEEIFYPALREVLTENAVLDKSKPEHDEMKQLIARLRDLTPDDPTYDSTFMSLMRDVLHHVADEETTLLPLAETLLADRLQELGAQMTRRRLQLVAPRAAEIGTNLWRATPTGKLLLLAGAAVAGTFAAQRAFASRR